MTASRQLNLTERPETKITASTFKVAEVQHPSPLPSDTFLVKVKTVALEPSMRISMKEFKGDFKGYREPAALNQKFWALCIGEVIESESKDYPVGQMVQGNFGFTEVAFVDLKNDETFKASPPRKIGSKEQSGFEPREHLSILSAPGMAGFVGLFSVGKWQRGGKQTLLVSGGAGATGASVIQMARITAPDSKIIAIAGGKEKCDYTKTLGANAALDYRSATFEEDLRKECGGDVDLYFDNVVSTDSETQQGGTILDLAITQIKMQGRITLCGQISGYNDATPYGVKNITLILTQSITMQGFIILPQFWGEELKKGFGEMSKWMAEGKLKSEFTLHQPSGLENIPQALQGLFEGKNTGKMLIDL